MHKTKFAVLILILLAAAYAVTMYFVPENKSFTVEKEINYPVDKVYPQFSSLQNFAGWNSFFSGKKEMELAYFSPYEGQGSSLTYIDHQEDDTKGDLFIRYANPEKTLKMQLFDGRMNNPYDIDLKFVPLGEKTKITWFVRTPKQPFLKRSLNLLTQDFWLNTIETSMNNLSKVLGTKIERDTQRENIKFDTVMIEQQEALVLLGTNSDARNKKDELFKNVVLTHNKLLNYVTTDLGRKSDEYGDPVLLTSASSEAEKEISYFYGVPVPSKFPITDNNFTFRTLNESHNYIVYYKGPYAKKAKTVQELLSKVKRDSLRSGMIQEVFLEEPSTGENVVLKLSLPVFK